MAFYSPMKGCCFILFGYSFSVSGREVVRQHEIWRKNVRIIRISRARSIVSLRIVLISILARVNGLAKLIIMNYARHCA